MQVKPEDMKKYQALVDELHREIAEYNDAVAEANDAVFDQQQELESRFELIREAIANLKPLVSEIKDDLLQQMGDSEHEELYELWEEADGALEVELEEPDAGFEEIRPFKLAALNEVKAGLPSEAERVLEERIAALQQELNALRAKRQ